MKLQTEWIEYEVEGKKVRGYSSRPAAAKGVPALVEAMKAQGKRFEHYIYPGSLHAFLNDTRVNYHAGAARESWARTLSFFATWLGGT